MVKEERGYLNTILFYYSCLELCRRQEFLLVLLIVVYKYTKVLLHLLVSILALSIYFRIVRRRQLSFNSKDLIKPVPHA